MPTTPTRRKRRLGLLLENLRLDVDKPLADASDMLRVSESTVSRYETGHVRPSWAALQALLAFYGATDKQREEAANLWDDAGERAVRIKTPAGSSKEFRAFLRAESEAATERVLQHHVIPGLLQTADYARAINFSSGRFYRAARPENYVTARLSRQHRLTDNAPLRLHAVMDEAAIRRTVGGPKVMIEQLRHLLAVGAQRNVTLQIVPFEAGAYSTMAGSFTIIGFEEPDESPAVLIENAIGGQWVEDVDDVKRFIEAFDETCKLALNWTETAKLVRSQVGALR